MDTPRDEPKPVTPAVLRVGDTERNSAIEALGEHLASGRLTVDEYGDRSAHATVAKTTADLDALFDDLPVPHPARPGIASAAGLSLAAAPGSVPATGGSAGGDSRSRAQKLVGAAAAGSVVIALALFFITGSWLWFLLIPGISAIASSIWGPDWREPNQAAVRAGAQRRAGDRRREVRDRRDDRRAGRRELGSGASPGLSAQQQR